MCWRKGCWSCREFVGFWVCAVEKDREAFGGGIEL